MPQSPVHSDLTPAAFAVFEALQRAMVRVEREFELALISDLPPVQRLVAHLATYRGKMLRPQMVALCGLAARPTSSSDISQDPLTAAALDAQISQQHIKLAAVCEMIHMATLVHDDVLDEADTRRKGATVNRLRGNETAVILGDYLFSAAYRLCSTLDSQHAGMLIGTCGMTLCTGELLQLHHRHNASIDEPTYFEIVKRKTGSLIATACSLGAWQSGATSDAAARFHAFGLDLGVAFQIQDDLLDLTGKQAVVGKPTHRDIELGKLTLPLIHHLRAAEPHLRAQTLSAIDSAPDSPAASAAAQLTMLDNMNHTGSIDYAKQHATMLVNRAISGVFELPDTASRQVLLFLAGQVVDRSA